MCLIESILTRPASTSAQFGDVVALDSDVLNDSAELKDDANTVSSEQSFVQLVAHVAMITIAHVEQV